MKIHYFEEIDSTQLEAKRFITGNPTFHGWAGFLANIQTNGQGQRGRTWHSYSGNLHVTYIIPYKAYEALGLQVAEVIYQHFPTYPFTFKWPNDFFLYGKKCGGILCEGQGSNTLIGIGLNLVQAPEGFAKLADYKQPDQPIQPIEELAKNLGERLQNTHWKPKQEATWNLPPLMYQNSWIDYTDPQGRVYNVYVRGLQDGGALCVHDENGHELILRNGRLGLATSFT